MTDDPTAELREHRKSLSEEENKLVKDTFKDNESLLQSIRALFYSLPITSAEKETIRALFQNEALLAIFHRKFCPEMDRNSPIGQVQDVWLGAEKMVYGASRDEIAQAVGYKAASVALVKKCLALLSDPDGERVSLDFTPAENDPLQIWLLSRNQFIRHVEQQLLFLWIIANQKEELTAKERAEKSTKNSSK